jgi:parallel beta-helix repeat protein
MRTAVLAFVTVVALLCLTLKAQQTFYVSPTGTPAGDGTMRQPWDLATALAHPPQVKPGSVIWLRGGTYSGTFVSRLNGTSAAPIIVRQYANERATIDSGFNDGVALGVAGSYTWFWGFEIMASGGVRTVNAEGALRRAAGVANAQAPGMGVGTKFINMSVHDTLLGFGWWKDAKDSELYGNIIFNNGWDMGDRGHGHGIYAQNETGTMRIEDNVILNQFGHGIHLYGSATAPLNNFYISGNIAFNNGNASSHGFARNLLVGGGKVAQRPVVIENYTYYPDRCCGTNDIGYDAGCTNLTLSRNYFINRGDTALNIKRCSLTAFAGNTFYGTTLGFNRTAAPSNRYHDTRPTVNETFVRPNRYEPGRAHIVVYNWTSQNAVSVDVSGAGIPVGGTYMLRSAEDYHGQRLTGVYNRGPITIPMTGWKIASPIGAATPRSALPEFGAFIITTS